MTVSAAQVVQDLLKAESNESITQIDLLTKLSQSSHGAEGIIAEFDVSKSSVYRTLDNLQMQGFVQESTTEVGTYELTGLGAVVQHQMQAQSESTDDILWDCVVYLCGGKSRPIVYAILQECPAGKADIARNAGAPSRPTVHRIVEGGIQRGLINNNSSGAYVLTRLGQAVNREYQTLVGTIEIIQRHKILFSCIGPAIADIPVHSLSSVEQIINEGTSPDQTVLAIESIVREGITDVRGLRSFVSLKLTEIFWPGIKSGTPHESIITTQVMRSLPTSGKYWKFVRHGLTASNVTVLVVPEIESFPYSLGILNGDTVVLGPAHPGSLVETPTGLKSETIIGRDSDLVDWAEREYSKYRQLGQRPVTHLTTEILEKLRGGFRANEVRASED